SSRWAVQNHRSRLMPRVYCSFRLIIVCLSHPVLKVRWSRLTRWSQLMLRGCWRLLFLGLKKKMLMMEMSTISLVRSAGVERDTDTRTHTHTHTHTHCQR